MRSKCARLRLSSFGRASQTDAGDQVVGHADWGPPILEAPAHFRGAPAGLLIDGQDGKRREQAPDPISRPLCVRSAQQLEDRDRGRRERATLQFGGHAAGRGLRPARASMSTPESATIIASALEAP